MLLYTGSISNWNSGMWREVEFTDVAGEGGYFFRWKHHGRRKWVCCSLPQSSTRAVKLQ